MKNQPDIYYQERGLFIRFIPHTEKGEEIWRDMAKHESSCTFLAMYKRHILKQLKEACVTYAKLPLRKMTEKETEGLLKELEELKKETRE